MLGIFSWNCKTKQNGIFSIWKQLKTSTSGPRNSLSAEKSASPIPMSTSSFLEDSSVNQADPAIGSM